MTRLKRNTTYKKMIILDKDNIKDVEYSVGCVANEDVPTLLESLLDEVFEINNMLTVIHGNKANLISIAWENEHTEYSPERVEPCPDYYGFFYIIRDNTSIGDAMSIDQLDESLALISDFVEVDYMSYF